MFNVIYIKKQLNGKPVYNGPSPDDSLSIFSLWCTILVHFFCIFHSYILFFHVAHFLVLLYVTLASCRTFLCCTRFVFNFIRVELFHIALFSSCTFFMLYPVHVAPFVVLLHVALTSCCTFSVLHFFSYCTIFKFHFFCVVHSSGYTFPCWTFFHFALFLSNIFFHVVLISCCTFFMLHSFHASPFFV